MSHKFPEKSFLVKKVPVSYLQGPGNIIVIDYEVKC